MWNYKLWKNQTFLKKCTVRLRVHYNLNKVPELKCDFKSQRKNLRILLGRVDWSPQNCYVSYSTKWNILSRINELITFSINIKSSTYLRVRSIFKKRNNNKICNRSNLPKTYSFMQIFIIYHYCAIEFFTVLWT